jgi:hypothetical protein
VFVPCDGLLVSVGLKHQQRAMAAAPAGFDEYSREGRAPAAEQQQGGGGLMAAVKRAVGQ